MTERPKLDPTVPHPARVYDYWLGGKENFEADRRAAEAAVAAFPKTVQSARAARAFLTRVVRYLTESAGIRQFLDIGSGLPTSENVHQVAQSVAPESRIVYADNDPLVMLHAQALLKSAPEGATGYVEADLRDPEKILRVAAGTLDFSQPVAVILCGVLHFVQDTEQPRRIVRTLVDAVPPGSYLMIAHVTADFFAEMTEFARRMNQMQPDTPVTLRGRDQVLSYFDGLELVEPGVVQLSKWHPRSEMEAAAPAALWGGVARKP